jgi:pSer/pThr/pTyr-binding forkhead associated (FHA) protein
MEHSHLQPHRASPEEMDQRRQAERAGIPFLLYRDDLKRQHIYPLDAAATPVTIGRAPDADVSLAWDDRVSRSHARLELVGEDLAADWTLVDDGPSRNGSFRNGERVRGRVRLRDGDALSFGDTAMLFLAVVPETREPEARAPGRAARPEAPRGAEDRLTSVMSFPRLTRESLSDSQRRVLAALARPYSDSRTFAGPASDERIAAETFLSVETVRGHLQALATRLGLQDLPEDQRRMRLLELAVQSGVLSGEG